jgi:hypothetical protein
MNAISAINQAVLTTTSELLSIINESRLEYGEKEVRRNDFVARCKDELDGDHYETFVVTNPNSTESEELRLTDDQCAYVSMRESKAVRRRVTEKLNALRTPKFDVSKLTRIDILKLAMESEEGRIKAEAERDIAIATKAQIGSKREASAMATARHAAKKANSLEIELDRSKHFATVKRMEMLCHSQKFNWRLLKSASIEMGIQSIDVFDANYGTVKAYHADVWREAYAIDMADLLEVNHA